MDLLSKPLQLIFLLVVTMWSIHASANTMDLPTRSSPVPQTTDGVPHVQIGVEVDREIYLELLRRVSEIPGVEIRETIISLPGAKGFWISEDITLARPDAIVRGREFAHVHPDGSLHAALPKDIAFAAIQSGWAILHPWANSRPRWEGFVMIYTPLSGSELDVVVQLVMQSYEFVTGRSEI